MFGLASLQIISHCYLLNPILFIICFGSNLDKVNTQHDEMWLIVTSEDYSWSAKIENNELYDFTRTSILSHSDSPNNGVSRVGSFCPPPPVPVESSVVDTVSEPVGPPVPF
jgi:hypothetical protein